jgi:hypothetical protein
MACLVQGNLAKSKVWYPAFLSQVISHPDCPLMKLCAPPKLYLNEGGIVFYEFEPFVPLVRIYKDRASRMDKFSDGEITKIVLDIMRCVNALEYCSGIEMQHVGYSTNDKVYRLFPRRGLLRTRRKDVNRSVALLVLRMRAMVYYINISIDT